MCVRRGLLCCCLVYVISQPPSVRAEDAQLEATQFWELGQKAMQQGLPDKAIGFYERSLAVDRGFRRSHLSLAAAHLQRKDEPKACAHLAEYLEAYPENLTVRERFAELLARLHHLKEAGSQYEAVIAAVQELPVPAARGLVACHTRMVELAEANEDSYCEHLHRGIGLYWLARKRSALGDAGEELPAQGLMCKAAAELTLANQERPDEARPCWYLYLVWTQLGQRQPALCRLRQADATAPFTHLTPAEQRGLCLACQTCAADCPR